ncbi:MAG: carbohydrate-binding protein, partial [Pedobacter sp.]
HKYWNYNDQASIAHILRAREEQNVPVWLGETGENSNVWFRDAIALLEKNNIGWAWWPLKKIGVNNPMEIHSNPNYDALVKFLNQNGPVPDAPNTYKGLMELAHSSRLERNSIHRDVIDAMIRQPFSNDTRPFKIHSVQYGAVIDAVDYDMGRNNYAYFDRDTADYHVSSKQRSAGNRGRIYRNDGVDIARDSSSNEQYYVNSIERGEWLQYTLNVSRSGTYTLKISTAATHSKGKLSILLDEKVVAESISVPLSGGSHKFVAFRIKDIKLRQGERKIRIRADEGDFNLSYIQFIK